MLYTLNVLYKATKIVDTNGGPLSVSSFNKLPKFARQRTRKMRATVVAIGFEVGTT